MTEAQVMGAEQETKVAPGTGEEPPGTAQSAAGAADAGGASAAAAPGTGGQAAGAGGGKGDLSVALRQAREENRKLRSMMANSFADKTRSGTELGIDAVDFSDVKVNEEMALDLAAGKTEAFNSALQGALKKTVATALQQTRQAVAANRGENDVVEMLGEYELFGDKAHPQLSRHALLVASTLIDQLPKGATRDQVRGVIDSVAKEFSAYKVAAQDDLPAASRIAAGPAGGGGDATTGHMATPRQSAGSLRKASDLFHAAVDRIRSTARQ